MSENDLIAEYIKQERPEILRSVDFMVFKMRHTLLSFAECFTQAMKNIDFDKLKQLSEQMEHENNE